jgi:hypothetical protein
VTIHEETTARRIASDWHGGQWSALYALASSGTVLLDVLDEIDECRPEFREQGIELADLYDWCAERIPAEDDEDGEEPDTCQAPDGHWYVITYGRASWEIHARDCEKCERETPGGLLNEVRQAERLADAAGGAW